MKAAGFQQHSVKPLGKFEWRLWFPHQELYGLCHSSVYTHLCYSRLVLDYIYIFKKLIHGDDGGKTVG